MSEPFAALEATTVRLVYDNIDTDQIIPARFLKVTDREGLGEVLFSDWRYDDSGAPKPDFPLNTAEGKSAEILVAGANFGSGSSREHAPWALRGYGFRAVVARSFADIFKNNSLKNGLLPIQLDDNTHAGLLQQLEADPGAKLKVELERETLTLPDGTQVKFSIDPFARKCLLEGIDQLGYLQRFSTQVEAFEKQHPISAPTAAS